VKQIALRPVEHLDAYTEAVQPHVQAYFDEVLFAPLFAMLREARAPMAGVKQAIGPDSRYDNADGWEPFPAEWPTLGIPRRMMPQVTADQREDVIAHLATLGVAHERRTLPAEALRPTQDEWSGEKVRAAAARRSSKPILISGDQLPRARSCTSWPRSLASRATTPAPTRRSSAPSTLARSGTRTGSSPGPSPSPSRGSCARWGRPTTNPTTFSA
jgi:hypothetical protein